MLHRPRTCRAVFCCVELQHLCTEQDAGGWFVSPFAGSHHHPQGFFEPCTVWVQVNLQTVWNMRRRWEAVLWCLCVHLQAWSVSPLCRLTHSCPHKSQSKTTTSFVWNPPALHWGFHSLRHFHKLLVYFQSACFLSQRISCSARYHSDGCWERVMFIIRPGTRCAVNKFQPVTRSWAADVKFDTINKLPSVANGKWSWSWQTRRLNPINYSWTEL